jgi:hypothetical protein
MCETAKPAIASGPHEPTGPREARPDDKLRDMRDSTGVTGIASLTRATLAFS